jgi:hypothetical protein
MEGLDIERSAAKTAATLYKIAEAIEAGKPFRVQINGHWVKVPHDAAFEIELAECSNGEVEIQMRWDNGLGH